MTAAADFTASMNAEPLFLSRSSSRHDSEPGSIHRQIPHAEKAGSGMLDIIARFKAAGLPFVRFHQEGGQMVRTLSRPHLPKHKPRTREAQEGPSSMGMSLMKSCAALPRSGRHLLAGTGTSARAGNFKKSLGKLLSTALIEMTIPKKPTSHEQKYWITKIGRKFLARLMGKVGKG